MKQLTDVLMGLALVAAFFLPMVVMAELATTEAAVYAVLTK